MTLRKDASPAGADPAAIRNHTGRTQLVCLLGSPVAHSVSPAMHNLAFSALGLDYAYLAFDTGGGRLAQAVTALKALAARGWNVTMPDKTAMCGLCDQLSDAARLTGSVNTVVNEGGILTGHTTDGIGYLRAAREAGFPLEGKRIVLLGAGGAAVSVLVQAALDGAGQISVFNSRSANFSRVEGILKELAPLTSCRLSILDYSDGSRLRDAIRQSDFLINATPVGMAPHAEGCLIPDASYFHPDLVVSDLIYNPRETRLLQMARAAGLPAFNGMDMLLYQGAEAFRLWTGQDMPVKLVKEAYFS